MILCSESDTIRNRIYIEPQTVHTWCRFLAALFKADFEVKILEVIHHHTGISDCPLLAPGHNYIIAYVREYPHAIETAAPPPSVILNGTV